MQRKIDWTPGTRFEKKKKRRIVDALKTYAVGMAGGQVILTQINDPVVLQNMINFLKEKWKL